MTCDFCCAGAPATTYLVSGFRVETPLEVFWNEDGAWAACELCARIIDDNRLEDLVQRIVRQLGVRGMPQVPVVFEHYRLLMQTLLPRRSGRVADDDPRLAGLQHVEGEPIGVAWHPRGDGSIDVAPIPAAPPHPWRP